MQIYYLFLSALTFLAWGYDKYQAKAHLWRIPERSLLILTFAGGAFGALLGMLFFRHKTRKLYFWISVIAGCGIHAAVFYLFA